MKILDIFKKKIKAWKEKKVIRRVDRNRTRRLQRAEQMKTVPELITLAEERAKQGKRKCRTPNYQFKYK